MQLLTDELRAQLPALYVQDNTDDPIVHAKFFTPDSSWTWYVTEGEPDGDDYRFFGYVNGHVLEAGYFMLSQLEPVRGHHGLPIERDLYFEPCPWSEVKKREGIEADPEEVQPGCGCMALDAWPPTRKEAADDNS